MRKMNKIAAAIATVIFSGYLYATEPYDSSKSYSKGEQVSADGKLYEAKWWANSGQSPTDEYANVWDSPWKLLGDTDPDPDPGPGPGDVIPFVPGETSVNNGDMVSYEGECYVAKNNPGVWETPNPTSWFWDMTECPDEGVDPPPVDPIDPELSITAPSNGQTVKTGEATLITVQAQGEANSKIEFWVNDNKLATQPIGEQSNYSHAWTPSVEGDAKINVFLFDEDNNPLLEQSVTVKVEGDEGVDPIEPELSITSPTNGQTVKTNETTLITVQAQGEPNSKIEFWVNSEKIGTQPLSEEATYSQAWTPMVDGDTAINVYLLDEQNNRLLDQSIIVLVDSEEDYVAPEVKFITPKTGSTFKKEDIVAISVSATDADDDLTKVVINANNQEICSFDATVEDQFLCNWEASQTGNVKLESIATDAQNLSSKAMIQITVTDIDQPPVPPPGELCKDFNVYPDWTRGDHATNGDIMVNNNIAYSAKYWTQTTPGSDDSWAHHLNCDGTPPGTAPLLSLPNPLDPLRLEVDGWPNKFVVASPSTEAPATSIVDTIDIEELSDYAKLTDAFISMIVAAEQANTSSIIISSNVLSSIEADQGASLETIEVREALTQALDSTGNTIDIQEINALSNDVKGWAQAQNLVLSTLAPKATFGWSLEVGDFAYDTHSGRQSVWDAASNKTADLLDKLELYQVEASTKADFVVFTKSDSTEALSSDQWHNALEYVKQVTDYVQAPALLAPMPTDQASTYFMGNTIGESNIRKASFSNVFAILFDSDSADLNTKIQRYESAKVPLYYDGEDVHEGPLTIIDSLNRELADAEYVMDNEAFLFETPQSQWIPSTVYKWADFLDGLNAMHNIGVAGNKFWLLDENEDDATNSKYAKVAIAAFLAQSMQETIRYNACDENNWSETRWGAPTDYPMGASCGQLDQKYADYGVNPISGLDHAYSCPRDDRMEVSALTHAQWYGAPAPVFAAPDSVLEERGLLVNGHVGRWSINGHCNDVPETVDGSKQVWERDECKVYEGQKAGKFIWDGSSQESVQGCGWWGRGVIQTTGRQNFGTLNHYMGRSHVDPDTIGKTVDGVVVEAPPENPLYSGLDFCSNPGLICSSEENREIKWIAGLFYWVTSVQAYPDENGQYPSWNYYDELKNYVDGGMKGNQFIDDVSGIVNRGCPDLTCDTGPVHNVEERRTNFKLVLEKLGLNPQ
ncbi:Ig-like domain-containing protein [Vibrio sp. TMPB1044]|uniref:Ig-like domain-containing protein n=1 Tax=Vibrio sp. TMPB1044 TaxID=3051822 RepID=UPI00255BB67F|nr:Ig-like domain-containing protein [Vibrio sp. TMPB1044]MDL5029223.1 Ig-like domain-containing protein [Vibrio sp. TMPB1044]MDN5209351.1 Ig-like domain-containing protein [Vibrio sp. TMPB1044]